MTNSINISKAGAGILNVFFLLLVLMPVYLSGQPSGTSSQGGGFSAGGAFENFSITGAAAPVARNLSGGNFSTDVGFLFTAPISSVQFLSLELNSADPMQGSVEGGGQFAPNTTVNAIAHPAIGYRFLSWKEGDLIVSTEIEFSFTLTRNRTLTAYFAPEIYALTLGSTPPNNLGGGTTGAGNYPFGSQVTVNALPNAFFTFEGWADEDGSIVSNESSYTFAISGNRHLTAQFGGETYDITVNPSANGSATGSGTYFRSDIVQAEAVASEGWYFLRWMDGDTQVSVLNPYLFSATSDRTLVAEFAEIWWSVKAETSLITADVLPSFTGIVLGQGFHVQDSTVTLTASPNQGITFLKWQENGQDILDENNQLVGPEYTFDASENRHLTAIFTGDVFTVQVAANPDDAGEVAISDEGEFFAGDLAILSATSHEGYVFAKWMDAVSGNQLSVNPEHRFTVTGDRDLVAHYSALEQYALTLSVYPEGAGTVSGQGNYFSGTVASVEATANPGYEFLYWTKGAELISYETLAEIVIENSATDLTAWFVTIDTFTLTFHISSEDGDAVDDATIMLHGNTIFEPGVYVFEGLIEESISYTVWRTGYVNQSGTIYIDQNSVVDISLVSLPSGNTSVYLLGNATSAGWDNQAALPMNHLGDGVFEIITEIVDATGYIKFISEPEQWTPQWGTDESGTSDGGPLIYRPVELIPDPMDIPAPVEGQYRIRADVINLEYSIELVTLPKITFIVLDGNNEAVPDARILLMGQPYPAGVYVFEEMEPGNYHYIIWKDGMTAAQNIAVVMDEDITITEILHLIPAEDYRFYLLGDATNAGWNNHAAIEMQSMGEGVFQTDVEIVQGSFIKFIAVSGQWAPQWGTNENGTSTSGALVYQPDPFVPTPDAIPAPPPGFYRVMADTINNTYSVTELTTGIILPEEDFLILYPNPARDILYLESSSAIASLAILDITGKIVYEKEVHFKSTSISLSGLRPGVFIVIIYNQNKVTTKKLIIER